MRKVVLSVTDVEMFNTDITTAEYDFYQKHWDAFRRMWKEQGQKYWIKYNIIYRHYASTSGLIQEVKELHGNYMPLIDELFIFFHEQFIDSKYSGAKYLIQQILFLAQHQSKIQFLGQKNRSKDPFYNKETRDCFRFLFGSPATKDAYIKTCAMYQVYLRYGGSLCTCLRRWLDAEEIADDDESYWTPPGQPRPAPVDAPRETCQDCGQEVGREAARAFCDNTFVSYMSEKRNGHACGPWYVPGWPLHEDPRFFDHRNPLYDLHKDPLVDWRADVDYNRYLSLLTYTQQYYPTPDADITPDPAPDMDADTVAVMRAMFEAGLGEDLIDHVASRRTMAPSQLKRVVEVTERIQGRNGARKGDSCSSGTNGHTHGTSNGTKGSSNGTKGSSNGTNGSSNGTNGTIRSVGVGAGKKSKREAATQTGPEHFEGPCRIIKARSVAAIAKAAAKAADAAAATPKAAAATTTTTEVQTATDSSPKKQNKNKKKKKAPDASPPQNLKIIHAHTTIPPSCLSRPTDHKAAPDDEMNLSPQERIILEKIQSMGKGTFSLSVNSHMPDGTPRKFLNNPEARKLLVPCNKNGEPVDPKDANNEPITDLGTLSDSKNKTPSYEQGLKIILGALAEDLPGSPTAEDIIEGRYKGPPVQFLDPDVPGIMPMNDSKSEPSNKSPTDTDPQSPTKNQKKRNRKAKQRARQESTDQESTSDAPTDANTDRMAESAEAKSQIGDNAQNTESVSAQNASKSSGCQFDKSSSPANLTNPSTDKQNSKSNESSKALSASPVVSIHVAGSKASGATTGASSKSSGANTGAGPKSSGATTGAGPKSSGANTGAGPKSSGATTAPRQVPRSARKVELQVCAFCHLTEQTARSFKKCLRCKQQQTPDTKYYCSKECQVGDWKKGHRFVHSKVDAAKTPASSEQADIVI